MRDADVRTVRSFNRLVTERVGALEDRYLATDLPEETSLSERAVRREIPIFERTDALGD